MNDLINELIEDVVKAKAKLRDAETLLNMAITADLKRIKKPGKNNN